MDSIDGQYLNEIAHAVADLAVADHIHTVSDVGAYRDAVMRETRISKGDHVRALTQRAAEEGVDLEPVDVAECVYRNLNLDEYRRDKAARQRLAALDAEIARNRQHALEDPPAAIIEPEQRPDGTVKHGGRLSKHTVTVGLAQIAKLREQLK